MHMQEVAAYFTVVLSLQVPSRIQSFSQTLDYGFKVYLDELFGKPQGLGLRLKAKLPGIYQIFAYVLVHICMRFHKTIWVQIYSSLTAI